MIKFLLFSEKKQKRNRRLAVLTTMPNFSFLLLFLSLKTHFYGKYKTKIIYARLTWRRLHHLGLGFFILKIYKISNSGRDFRCKRFKRILSNWMCENEGGTIYRLLERGVIHNTIKKDQSKCLNAFNNLCYHISIQFPL